METRVVVKSLVIVDTTTEVDAGTVWVEYEVSMLAGSVTVLTIVCGGPAAKYGSVRRLQTCRSKNAHLAEWRR